MKRITSRFTSFLLTEGFFHRVHGVALGGFRNVDVGLHGLVVGVSGEFHHDVRRDAVGEGETDEGLAAGILEETDFCYLPNYQ